MTKKKTCRECLEPMPGGMRPDAKYCSKKCEKSFYNRRIKRGARLYDLAMQWRDRRREINSEEDNQRAFGWLCEQVGRYLDEDREEGRRSYIKDAWTLFP